MIGVTSNTTLVWKPGPPCIVSNTDTNLTLKSLELSFVLLCPPMPNTSVDNPSDWADGNMLFKEEGVTADTKSAPFFGNAGKDGMCPSGLELAKLSNFGVIIDFAASIPGIFNNVAISNPYTFNYLYMLTFYRLWCNLSLTNTNMDVNTMQQKNGKTIYLNNKELLSAFVEAKEVGKLTNRLAAMFQLLCARYATKGNWVNYSYNEDMQAYAILMLTRTWYKFNPEKSNNPFAFYTQCVKNSFLQYLRVEKKQQIARDTMMVNVGLNPSHSFQENASDQHYVEDEQDYFHYTETIQELEKSLLEDDDSSFFKEEIDELSDVDVDTEAESEAQEISIDY